MVCALCLVLYGHAVSGDGLSQHGKCVGRTACLRAAAITLPTSLHVFAVVELCRLQVFEG